MASLEVRHGLAPSNLQPFQRVPAEFATEPPPRPPPAMPARLQRLELDYAALDTLIADTNRAVERVQRLLKSR